MDTKLFQRIYEGSRGEYNEGNYKSFADHVESRREFSRELKGTYGKSRGKGICEAHNLNPESTVKDIYIAFKDYPFESELRIDTNPQEDKAALYAGIIDLVEDFIDAVGDKEKVFAAIQRLKRDYLVPNSTKKVLGEILNGHWV
jgi:hypothetical protein